MRPQFIILILMLLVSACRDKEGQLVTLYEPKNPAQEVQSTPIVLDHDKTDLQALLALAKGQAASPLDRKYVIDQFMFKTASGRRQLVQYLPTSSMTSEERASLLLNLAMAISQGPNSCLEWNEMESHLTTFRQDDALANVIRVIDHALQCDGDQDPKAVIEILNGQMIQGLKDISTSYQHLFIQAYWHAYEKLLQSDQFPLHGELALTFNRGMTEETRPFFARLMREIQARTNKIILSKNKLILPESNIQNEAPEFKPLDWNISYHVGLGRCSGASKSLTTQGVEDSYNQQCNYPGGESNSTIVQLGYSVHSEDFGPIQRLSAAVHSNVHGGFADHGDENQTASLSYTIRGSGVIPKCNNPLICWPMVKVVRLNREQGRFYTGISKSDPRNSSYSLSIGGKTLNEGESLWIDRSQGDVVIDIVMRRSDSHVGACCDPGAGQQLVGIDIIGLKKPSPVMLANSLEQHYQLFVRGMNQYAIPGVTSSLSPFPSDLLQVSERDFDYLGAIRGIPADMLTRNNTRFDWLIHAGFDWNDMLESGAQYKALNIDGRFEAYYGVLNLINWIFGNRAAELSGDEANYLQLLRQSLSNHARKYALNEVRQRNFQAQEELSHSAYKIVKELHQNMSIAYEYQTNATAANVNKLTKLLTDMLNDRATSLDNETVELARLATELSSNGIAQREILLQSLRELSTLLDRLERREQYLKSMVELTTLELVQYGR